MGGVAERLSTDQKGAIAEAAIAYAAIKLGIGVLKPLTDGHRYDLVFDLRDRLERVQCKWAPLERGAVVVRSYSCRRTATGLRKRIYSTSEIDAVVAPIATRSTGVSTCPRTVLMDTHRSFCASPRRATIRRPA